jgi:hypothetical protein
MYLMTVERVLIESICEASVIRQWGYSMLNYLNNINRIYYRTDAKMLNGNGCCPEYMRRRWTSGMLPAIVLVVWKYHQRHRDVIRLRHIAQMCPHFMSRLVRLFGFPHRSSTSASDHQGHLRGVEFHEEKGPSLGPPQLPTVLTRLPRDGCRVTLLRTSLRPNTLPNPNTSGRSRSNGSDCRTVRPVGRPGVNNLVPGRLGPGSPKYE